MFPAKDNLPVERFPFVTVGLMLANVVVFIVAGSSRPATFTAATVFSSLFIQTSVLQLIGNLWFLWLFGSSIEDSMGPVRFLAFYLAGGLVATGVTVAVHPGLAAPPVGAAGAVAAVIGGYLILYRGARIIALSLIPFFSGAVEIPPLVLVAAWVAMQSAFAAAGFIAPGGVAYVSWLGGFAFGLVAVRPLTTHRKPIPPTAALSR
ncbi:MAG TPA: rhomboid family intramembrane serine protease [Solirubrobacteraceae bacterium]|jgi:membrane associated rhomboid family serine protease|nr:rhomboid family intramembrane serine protease [Solirubrobacteraceae bacterium]